MHRINQIMGLVMAAMVVALMGSCEVNPPIPATVTVYNWSDVAINYEATLDGTNVETTYIGEKASAAIAYNAKYIYTGVAVDSANTGAFALLTGTTPDTVVFLDVYEPNIPEDELYYRFMNNKNTGIMVTITGGGVQNSPLYVSPQSYATALFSKDSGTFTASYTADDGSQVIWGNSNISYVKLLK